MSRASLAGLGLGQTSKSAGGEVSVDVKLIKVARKTDGKREPTAYEKLAAVEDWIYAHEPVGTINEPAPWVSGRLDLAESIVPALGTEDTRADAVLFAAKSKNSSYLLMGGSAAHLDQATSPADLPRMTPRASRPDQIFFALQRFAANTSLRDLGAVIIVEIVAEWTCFDFLKYQGNIPPHSDEVVEAALMAGFILLALFPWLRILLSADTEPQEKRFQDTSRLENFRIERSDF